MFLNNLLLCVVLLPLVSRYVSAAVGDPCTFRRTNIKGVCKVITDCPEADQKANTPNAVLTLCGYQFTTPIVCCKKTVHAVPNDGTLSEDFLFPDQINSNSNFNQKRISEKKCEKYSESVYSEVLAIPLVANAEPTKRKTPKCPYNSVPLIVGGKPAAPDEFPHMAAIGYDGEDKWRCGGTLISHRFVVTAAHCASVRSPPTVVRVGELYVKFEDANDVTPNDYRVARIIQHPGYNPPYKYNDIALLQTAQRITFSTSIRPACLFTKNIINYKTSIATGWGRTGIAANPSEVLRKVSLEIYDNSICNKRYANKDELPRGIAATMICAGSLAGGNDTCQGDSGGPLVITNEENHCKFYLIGVTSFGISCAQVNTPAVYTRISEFVPWIEQNVWPNES